MSQGVSDAVCADFNNDLLPDILMVRQKNASGAYNNSAGQLSAVLMPPDSAEHGFSFLAADSIHLFLDLNPYQQYNIHIGSSGYTPSTTSFYLRSADTINHGMSPHSAGVDEGIYIGFDTLNNNWSISYCVLDRNKIGVRIQSQTISQPTLIGFTPSSPLLPAYYEQTTSGFTHSGLTAGFTDSLHAASVVAGDFDYDMDLDVLIGCNNGVINLPEVLYENNGSGIFTKVPGAAGAISSSYGRTESITTADFDLDGFLDLLIANGEGQFLLDNAPYQLFRNSGNANNWLAIDLQGTTSNRNGIGAKVYVTAGGITQMREQNNGMHFASQNFRRIHFGLGPNYLVSLLEVHWPDGTIQQFQNIAANQILTINQSTGPGSSPANILSDRLTVFPNPANDYIFIRYPSHVVLNSDLLLRIFHSSGTMVLSQIAFYPDYPVSICISHLLPGFYYVNITSSNAAYHAPLVIVR
jgi:hypothetical protein